MAVEELLFDVAEALRVPVLVLALVALAAVLVELGGLVAELWRRRGRGVPRLDLAVVEARGALVTGDQTRAKAALARTAVNSPMRDVLATIVDHRNQPGGSDRIAKDLAEFDYGSIRRLERTRILVRVGPALGLMGTLIPLSPALVGLAEGDVQTLTDNLRVAFSVTVAGLMVGAIAFGSSLVRDRLYGQDFSDLEYVAAKLAPGVPLTSPTATSTSTTPAVPAPQATPAASTATTTVATPAPAPAASPAKPSPPQSPPTPPASS